jgi:hypothetical protein
MFSAARTAPLTRSGPRPQPIAFSLVAHAGILSLVVLGPAPHTSSRPQSLYEQVIKPHEHELVWYSFRQKLPEVSPSEVQHSEPAGAELKSPGQTIISNPKQGERGSRKWHRPTSWRSGCRRFRRLRRGRRGSCSSLRSPGGGSCLIRFPCRSRPRSKRRSRVRRW